MLRMYNILLDDDGNRFVNIMRTYQTNPELLRQDIYEIYTVDEDDWWDNISAEAYQTPYLWWVLPIVNNISNPFESLEPGSQIKILRYEYVPKIFDDLAVIEDLP
jgi:hypothetical protein